MISSILLTHMVISFMFLIVFFLIKKECIIPRFFIISIVILIPYMGVLFVLTIMISSKLWYFKEDNPIEEVKTKNGEWLYRNNLIGETQVFSFNEVFYEKDVYQKRETVLNLIKDDASKWSNQLKYAVMDSDSEVRHYAASALTQVRRELISDLTNFEKNVRENNLDEEKIFEYFNKVKKNINSCVLYNDERENIIKIYVEQIEKIENFIKLTQEIYTDKIEYELELRNYKKAEIYCRKFVIEYKNSDKPYLLYLKYFLKTNNTFRFKKLASTFGFSESQAFDFSKVNLGVK